MTGLSTARSAQHEPHEPLASLPADPLEKPRTIGALLDVQAARIGSQPFLRFDGSDTTYEHMAATTIKLANALLSAGVQPGDKLAIMAGNRPEFLQAWFATTRIGVVEVPVNLDLRGRFLSYLLSNSNAAHLLIEHALLEHLAAVVNDVPELRTVIVLDAPPGGTPTVAGKAVHRFEELLSSGNDSPRTSPSTSGTLR